MTQPADQWVRTRENVGHNPLPSDLAPSYTHRRMANRSGAAMCALIAFFAPAIPILARQLGGAANALTVNAPVHHVFDDRMAREPMLVEHPTGALFVAGYGMLNRPSTAETPNLWKSADGGKTFSRVNVGTTDQGALGNSDVDLAVGPDGILYFV